MQTLFDIELEDGRTFTVNNTHPMYVVEDNDFTFTDELAARLQRGSQLHFKTTTISRLKLRACECAGRRANSITFTWKGRATRATPIMQTAFWFTTLAQKGSND
jgi:hypothetical protein